MENNFEKERQEALATLNHIPIETQLKHLEGAVLEGFVSGVDATIAVKKIQTLLDELKKNIKDSSVMEMRSFPAGYTCSLGKVELRSTASRWSYKHITQWVEKKQELNDIENLAKAAANTGRIIYDDDGVEIMPAAKSGGAETLFVTLSKDV